jgi:hypothetical protein
MSKSYIERLQGKLETMHLKVDKAHSERNMLVALLSKIYPSVRDIDQKMKKGLYENVIYIQTPLGQISYHIAKDHMEYFEDLEIKKDAWDGHTTEQKKDRVKRLIKTLATIREINK